MKDEFWWRLQSFEAPNVFNPWSMSDPWDRRLTDIGVYPWEVRHANLVMHLAVEPRWILIGEAPGWRGCHFSGIPFTSEKQIFNHEVPYVARWGRITSRTLPFSESSATIVWRTLRKLEIVGNVILWNAFPWHPHKPDNPYSNRTPTRDELKENMDVLAMLLDQKNSDACRIIAVGHQADLTLRWIGRPADRIVRHPSMGGAAAFASQLEAIVNE